MKFLVPIGGCTDDAFGIMTSPSHKGIPSGIIAGLPWAADNNAFTGFDARKFFPWLESMTPYQDTCLFVAVPDVVGDAKETLAQYDDFAHIIMGRDWTLAYVAQDGSEELPIPQCDAVFIGGTTEWKESLEAVSVIKRAQQMGKHIHIGRVNWKRRYDMFNILAGSEHFTCDGTRTRFDGTEKALKAWKEYQGQRPLFGL